MSGTSLDGVDAALVDFSVTVPRVLATHFAPFDPELRRELMALQNAGDNELERGALAGNRLAHAYARGVSEVLRSAAIAPSAVRAIGAHGQTVRHRPAAGFSIQLNNPALLAELSSISVAADFRSRDIAAGGQGAPLAPAFHRAYFGAPDKVRAVVNIGGIANVTLLGTDGGVQGFDTGPGNILLDAWCSQHRHVPYDAGGQWAAGGEVLPELLEAMLLEPYFALPAPKSTGRDLFSTEWLTRALGSHGTQSGYLAADVQATLLELTALTIASGLATTPSHLRADTIYICGGGAHNTRLMQVLSRKLAPATVSTTAELGVPPDWVEAVAFAWLAKCLIEGLPSSLTAVTGARGTRILGAIFPA